MYRLRGLYYWAIKRLADVDLLQQFTGFGLYDGQIMDVLRGLREPYPYFRGLISEVGYNIQQVGYASPNAGMGGQRITSFPCSTWPCWASTSYSKVPLRLATLLGFFTAGLSLLVGAGYLVAKVIFWKTFSAGIAPVVVGMFFLGSVQLLFMGIVGEYVGAVFTYAQNRPLVIEKERINF